jgi:hypothetical protein
MDNGNVQGIRSTCRVIRSFTVPLNLLGLGQKIPRMNETCGFTALAKSGRDSEVSPKQRSITEVSEAVDVQGSFWDVAWKEDPLSPG